jgi:hypothetical protein
MISIIEKGIKGMQEENPQKVKDSLNQLIPTLLNKMVKRESPIAGKRVSFFPYSKVGGTKTTMAIIEPLWLP